MRIVAQRVKSGKVEVEGKITGQIGKGFVLLVGFTLDDNEETVSLMAKKLSELRVFEDENGKMNKSIYDIEGKVLSVSQFTLYADITKGRRPGFEKALEYNKATELYNFFNEELRKRNLEVEEGIFGEDMLVSLENDGPVTIILDSKELL